MESMPEEPDKQKITGQELPGMPAHTVSYGFLLDGTITPEDVAQPDPKTETVSFQRTFPRNITRARSQGAGKQVQGRISRGKGPSK